jgi:hypothetical protein
MTTNRNSVVANIATTRREISYPEFPDNCPSK